MGLYERHVLGI